MNIFDFCELQTRYEPTGWELPKEFPNLSNIKRLSLDTETYDPELKTFGPGWGRHKGYIAGVSLATDDKSWYFPVRHPENNLDIDQTYKFLNDVLNTSTEKIGANLTYDIGWLKEEGVKVSGVLRDVQFAEALLFPGTRVGLEHLGAKYVGEGKDTNALYHWCALQFGGTETDQRSNIYRAPSDLVGKYAEMDALLPLQIYDCQKRFFDQDPQLWNVFNLECALIPLMIDMRFTGVKVDLEQAEQLKLKFTKDLEQIEEEIVGECHLLPNLNASASIAPVFDSLGISYPRTTTGKPSFDNKFLKTLKHPIGGLIIKWRELYRIKNMFIEEYILKAHVNGRIHTSYNQLKSDTDGTITGRFSSNKPNLQNIPARTPEGKLVRSLFIPDERYQWIKYDYSQIEYRCLAHFAQGPSGDTVRKAYIDNPRTDFHTFVQDMILRIEGLKLDRKFTKIINFGLNYGMGKATLAKALGVSLEKAEPLFEAYHKALPFSKDTMRYFMNCAENFHEVRTLKGRKTLFNMWQPKFRHAPALPLENASKTYAGEELSVAFTYKSLNYVLQGTAADIIKTSMLELYNEGIFKQIGNPLTQVHDELNFNYIPDLEPHFKRLREILENTVKLHVPIICDREIGPNWANVEEIP